MRLESALSRAGRYDEVAVLFRQRLSSVPNDNNARLRLGIALFELGQIDSAAASWEPLLQKATNTHPFAIIADRYRKRNLDKRAEQTYRRARTALKTQRFLLANSPNSPNAAPIIPMPCANI